MSKIFKLLILICIALLEGLTSCQPDKPSEDEFHRVQSIFEKCVEDNKSPEDKFNEAYWVLQYNLVRNSFSPAINRNICHCIGSKATNLQERAANGKWQFYMLQNHTPWKTI